MIIHFIKNVIKSAAVSGYIVLGRISKYPRHVILLEHLCARLAGKRHAVSFCNGTSAIEAALFSLEIGPGDKVAVPAYTVPATINAVLNVGATPVFIDCDRKTFAMDANHLSEVLKSTEVDAAIFVHMWRSNKIVKEIQYRCLNTATPLIEDCSHAHGGVINGQKAGSFGVLSCFSLQGYKAVSAYEGGFLATDNQDLIDRAIRYGHFSRMIGTNPRGRYSKLINNGYGRKLRINPLGALCALVDLAFLNIENKKIRTLYLLALRIIEKNHSLSAQMVEPKRGDADGGFYLGFWVTAENEAAKEWMIKSFHKFRIKTNRGYIKNNHQLPLMQSPQAIADNFYPKGTELPSIQNQYPSLPSTEFVTENSFCIKITTLVDLIKIFLWSKINVHKK